MPQTAGERIAPDENPHSLAVKWCFCKRNWKKQGKNETEQLYIDSLTIQILPGKHIIFL